MTEFRAPRLRIVATPRRETTPLSTPRWYRAKTTAQQRAVWVDQLTARESARELTFWHRIMAREALDVAQGGGSPSQRT